MQLRLLALPYGRALFTASLMPKSPSVETIAKEAEARLAGRGVGCM